MNRRQFTLGLAASTTSLSVAGCNSSDVLSVARKANAPLPRDVVLKMKANGMTKSSPIMMRIFKQEDTLEVWKRKDTGRYDLVKSYNICKYSGVKGPKFKEGDRQAPEGFYFVDRRLMNPNSQFYLSFNLGFPNRYDRSHGRTGTFLMVHGDCSSAGCYAMTDEGISEIYAFARDALAGGQQAFQVQAFPFRMTPENMAEHRNDEHFEYWKMLKEGYDHFEITKVPPKVDVCDRRYVFNVKPKEGGEFSSTRACPEKEMPHSLEVAYTKHQNEYALQFEEIVAKLEGRAVQEIELLPIPVDPAASSVAPASPDVIDLDEVAANNPAPAPANVIATASASGQTAVVTD